jgi:hypothetical protein
MLAMFAAHTLSGIRWIAVIEGALGTVLWG